MEWNRTVGRRAWLPALAISWTAVGLASPAPAAAQIEGPPLTLGGLLRAGLRLEPEDAPRADGFELFDARLNLGGEVGIIFDYFLEAEYADEDREFRLLDARLTLPFMPEANLSIGQFKAPFGQERLQDKGDIRFVERAQASEAVAPGRQVGLELWGGTLEDRLTYRGGVFNGNGRTLRNDDNNFLYAVRVQYNTVGPIEFYEDLVVQVGADLAFSEDSAVALDPGLDGSLPGQMVPPGVDFADFQGKRVLWGLDLHVTYRGWGLDGEFLRGVFDPDAFPAGSDDLVAEGGFVEGTYAFFGAAEAVLRYDGFDPALGPYRDFLVLGLNVYPGFHAKFGLQFAIGLKDDVPAAANALADTQFSIMSQVDF